ATNNVYSQQLVVTGGKKPYTFKVLDPANAPPGITLDTSTGMLGGTPTSTGSFSFNVQVSDSSCTTLPQCPPFAVSKVFQITVASGMAPIQPSPSSLQFLAAVGGDRPAPQSLGLASTTGSQLDFTVQVQGPQPNTTPQFSLTVNPTSAFTPGRLDISVDQGT